MISAGVAFCGRDQDEYTPSKSRNTPATSGHGVAAKAARRSPALSVNFPIRDCNSSWSRRSRYAPRRLSSNRIFILQKAQKGFRGKVDDFRLIPRFRLFKNSLERGRHLSNPIFLV